MSRFHASIGPVQGIIPIRSQMLSLSSTSVQLTEPDHSFAATQKDHFIRRHLSLPDRQIEKSLMAGKGLDCSALAKESEKVNAYRSFPISHSGSRAWVRPVCTKGRLQARVDVEKARLEISLKKMYPKERLLKGKIRRIKPTHEVDFSETDFSRLGASFDSHDLLKKFKAKDKLTQNIDRMVKEQAHRRTPFKQVRQRSAPKFWNLKVLARNSEIRKAAGRTVESKQEDFSNLKIMMKTATKL